MTGGPDSFSPKSNAKNGSFHFLLVFFYYLLVLIQYCGYVLLPLFKIRATTIHLRPDI
jgi:hypothetical protein